MFFKFGAEHIGVEIAGGNKSSHAKDEQKDKGRSKKAARNLTKARTTIHPRLSAWPPPELSGAGPCG